ncbi:hypothetical protein H4R26_002576 [Coemansia thaxteri]|uniref:LIM zinc-binding domain-containing protein n=1 Tax=Coemansia thaxteri TaxID=2663907 RepID=A0A9W8BJK5_9FUNG|nr:hypothetical protein H4R26_002576 [Coemansia thaxteri]KAJ2484657.1 hypothetical protein EV174_002264 [Coemansia sp. RSA 2320]
MFCHRCGEIVQGSSASCKRCGGRAVESTTGSGVMSSSGERKDPWTSKYVQRRLNPSNVTKGPQPGAVPRPISTAYLPSATFDNASPDLRDPRVPQRPLTGSPGGSRGLESADLAGLPRPRPFRDAMSAGSSRPASMHFSSALPGIQPGAQPSIQPSTQPGAQQGLKSKWSQYFTSTAAAEAPGAALGGRTRSESLSASAAGGASARGASAMGASAMGVSGAGVPAVARAVPASTAAPATAARAPAYMAHAPSPAPSAKSALPARAPSTIPAERARSATLPGSSPGGDRPCTTCGRALRAEEQRQFAAQAGVVYCTDCYHSSYSRGHCAGCGKIVLTNGRPWAQYGDRVWHKLCIRCRTCTRLLVAPLVDADAQPTCEPCFVAANSHAAPPPPAAHASPMPPRARFDPPVPSAIGGSTTRPLPSPASGRSSAQTTGPAPPVSVLTQQSAVASAAVAAAASIPTPVLSEYDPPDAVRVAAPRVMSPGEVAAQQGLPPPRSIVDPASAAAPVESPADTAPLRPAPRPPLSPSLRSAASPASRTASPRSVSFRFDEQPVSAAATTAVEEELDEPRSLADYVLSKASGTVRPKPGVVATVADTIKKLADSAASSGPAVPRRPPPAATAAVALPELHDMLRTHQREPPTDPTVPALDHHSRILKSRPRNTNRRHPPALASPEPVAEPVAPNVCARCAKGIEDTWFRLSDGRQVHVECFSCQGCSALIDDGVYVLEGGIEFHPQCVPPAPPPIVSVSPVPSSHSSQGRVRGPRAPRREETCDRCRAVLAGPRFQLTNGKQYHPECFACAGCGQRFDEGSYVCFEGHEYHHHCVDKLALRNPPAAGPDDDDAALTCAQCSKPIEGMFLRHSDAVFHPACFCCNDCRRPITPGMPFGEIDSRPCCESCLERRATAQQQQQQQQHSAWTAAPEAPKAIVLDSGASITAAGEQERRVRRQFVSIRAEALGTVRAFPQSLRKLNELFQALDHAVLFGGQSSVVYHRVRRGVEVMAKRTFGWRELGQILALYPESYSHEALQTTHEGRRVVSVVLTPKVQGLALASEIEARREEFAHRLMAHVDVAHRAFLVDRGYAPADLAAVEGHWHPSFDIESTPAVTPLQLPPAPAPSSLATFDRERLRHLLGAVPAAKPPAVLTLLPPTPADSPVLQPAATPAAARPPISGAKNLLERIREKQRAKEAALQAAVQAVPAATRTMHSRLPAILEAISFLFYSERRNVLPLLFVVDKLVESKDLERADLSRHIVALTEFVPEWCSIVDVGAAASSSKGEATGPPPPPQAPGAEPSPDARLAVTRTISMQEAKTRLAAKIAAVV